MGQRLARAWFARPATALAPASLGQFLCRRLPSGELLRARIVETEAYLPEDPASHSFRGPTARNASMFGMPGLAYVYLIYGIHLCLNVVAGAQGEGTAVLLRAAEPLEGIERMRISRGGVRDRDLCRGPARLASAFSVDREIDGEDLVTSETLWIEQGPVVASDAVAAGPRVGIRVGVESPWRFWERGSPWVSGPVSRRAPRAASRP
jgi:DNA-3-methyladenine glycosylase